MAPLSPDYMALLETTLARDFVPHLPPLQDQTKPADQQNKKNLSRAFSAFALHKLCEISPADAAAAVIDDFDDLGIDAIYYQGSSETLFVVQGKLKASETFSQDEANAFCQGARRLIKQDFNGFNGHVTTRQVEIEGALEACSHIQLVVAHTGAGISNHAETAIKDLLNDEDHGEERLKKTAVDYGSVRVAADLQAGQAYPRVDANLTLHDWASSMAPRKSYLGLVKVADLVGLHEKNGKALYAKNIRVFLGLTTEVNRSIRDTLATNPADFMYLNNGVTALCEQIDPKNGTRDKKKFKVTGLSVINGAQTIASSARYAAENQGADISAASVLVTLIKSDSDESFGKAVTRARNHQNPVLLANFAALDDQQERLRRELAYLDIYYAYKAEGPDNAQDPKRIRIDEAAQALALLQSNPRYVVWLKKEPAQLLDTESTAYQNLFNATLTGIELVNSVRALRYIQSRMLAEVRAANGPERLTYKHGGYGLGFVLVKRIRQAIAGAKLIDDAKLKTEIGAAFDAARQTLWGAVQPKTALKGPLAIFRNQTDAIPLLRDVMIDHYGLAADPAIAPLKAKAALTDPYPQKALFDFLSTKAPQIGNIT
jgi:AIPR protein